MVRSARAAALLASALLVACPGERGHTAPPGPGPACNDLVANGSVDAVAVAPDGTAYLGGSFTALGPYTGPVAVLDGLTGALAAPVPMIGSTREHPGTILAAANDGHGGFYVGGQVTIGPDASEMVLAHVSADGTIDPAFDASLDGPVYALAVGEGVLYIAGEFDHVGPATRHKLAALDPVTGAVTAWDPMGASTEEYPLRVRALALGNETIYAAGDAAPYGFSVWMRAIDPAGAVRPWRPVIDADAEVRALAVRDGTLFVGGWFSRVDGQPREGLAAFDPSGALSTWSVPMRGLFNALAVMDGVLYAGGSFGFFDGHRGIIAIDPAGTPSVWDAAMDFPGPEDAAVSALAASGGTLFVGGRFETIGGVRRMNLAAFDTSGALLAWDPVANRPVDALASAAGRVLAGGSFTSINALRRSRLAALDSAGRLTTWDPDVDGSDTFSPERTLKPVLLEVGVDCLAFAGDRIYLGGQFDRVGGSPRSNLAAVDLAGNVLPGTPAGGGNVCSLPSFDPAAGGSVLPFDPALATTRGTLPASVCALAARRSTR